MNIFRDINDDDLENDIREAFRCFDKDALGYIPVPSGLLNYFLVLFLFCLDLTRILETLGDKLAPVETQEMMILADEDGDGNINYEEFISMLFKVGLLRLVGGLTNNACFRDPMGKHQLTRPWIVECRHWRYPGSF